VKKMKKINMKVDLFVRKMN